MSVAPVTGASNDVYPGPLEDFTVPANSCGFEVSGHYLSGFTVFIDHYNNAGDIVLGQTVGGNVKLELTNVETTKSVVLNITGPVWMRVYSLEPLDVVPMYMGLSLGWGPGYLIQHVGRLNEFDGWDAPSPGRSVDICALLEP